MRGVGWLGIGTTTIIVIFFYINSVYYKYDALELEPETGFRSTTSICFSRPNARAAPPLPPCFAFAAASASQNPRPVGDA